MSGRRLVLVCAGVAIAGVTVLVLASYLVPSQELSNAFQSALVSILAATIAALVSALFFRFAVDHRLPIVHSVAFIGYPGAGKTSLIATILRELVFYEHNGIDVSISSPSTMRRVQEVMKTLRFPPSEERKRDEDIAAYRIDLTMGSSRLKKTFQMQIADFSGEYMGDFLRFGESMSPSSPVAKWLAGANVVVFVISTAELNSDSSYFIGQVHDVDAVSMKLHDVWQSMLISARNQPQSAREKEIVVAFTKSDMLLSGPQRAKLQDVARNSEQHDKYAQYLIDELVTSQTIPVEQRFAKLLNFLRANARRFEVVLTSQILSIDSKPMGTTELLRAILPSTTDQSRVNPRRSSLDAALS